MVEITPEGSGYKVEWSDLGLTAMVRHIKDRPAQFKAQVAISHQGYPVHRSNPVLDSTSGMDALVRKLNKRRDGADYGIAWDQVVEDLSGIVIDTHRRGVSELVISDVPVNDSVNWRVDNILIEGNAAPNLIWADGGTGKSMFALWLSVLIQTGHASTDHGLVVEPGNVLYLDWETDQYEVANRTQKIHKGLGIAAPSGIVYRYMGLPLVDDVDRVRDIMHRRDIDVVIIDSMGLAVSGEMESAETVLSFFRAIRLLGKTTLIVSHANRQGTIFGSAYTINASRSVWEAKKSAGNSGGIDFGLFHRKANNIPIQSAQSWSVDFRDDAVIYTRGDVFKTDNAGTLSYGDLIYKILQTDGPKTKEYLEDTIKGMKGDPVERVKSNVATAISRHKRNGKVAETGDGMVSLVPAGAPQAPQEGEGEWTI